MKHDPFTDHLMAETEEVWPHNLPDRPQDGVLRGIAFGLMFTIWGFALVCGLYGLATGAVWF